MYLLYVVLPLATRGVVAMLVVRPQKWSLPRWPGPLCASRHEMKLFTNSPWVAAMDTLAQNTCCFGDYASIAFARIEPWPRL